MDWAKFKFRKRWGQLAIYDEQWNLISGDHIHELTDELITLCDQVMQSGSQEQVIKDAWLGFLRETIKESTWFFNPTQENKHPHRGCVYFLRDPQNLSITKVGYTAEISQRVRTLSGIVTNNDHRLDLIAVAYTDDFKLLEVAIHQYLKSSHTEGEWFLSDSVDNLISEVKTLINYKGA